LDNLKDTYLTIEKNSKASFKEKGSKFICLAYSVESEERVKEIIKELRTEYYDAGHHCYGFRIGSDYKTYRFSDDGEPSGTAGKPIYGQIQSLELTNVLVVVIRYFGGTKLGVPGLIKAYKTGAIEALEANTIVEKQISSVCEVKFEYSKMNDIMRVIKEYDLKILKQDFQTSCLLEFEVRLSKVEEVTNKLVGLQFEPNYLRQS